MSKMVSGSGQTAPIASLSASLDGIRELYIIVVGIGITESLVNLPTLACSWTFVSYVVLLIGFLATVFRFMLEGIIFVEGMRLGSEEASLLRENSPNNIQDNTPIQRRWRRPYFLMVLLILSSGVMFYLMGHNMNHFLQFMLFTVMLLLLDIAVIAMGLWPWQTPPEVGMGHALRSFVSLITAYRLFPSKRPECKRVRTFHQWIRSNLCLTACMLGLIIYWQTHSRVGGCPFGLPTTLQELDVWVQFLPQKLWVSQWLLGILLASFALWDIIANYDYYFGD